MINTLLQLSDAAADQFATPKPDISAAVRAQFASSASPAKQLKKGGALPSTKETPTKAGAVAEASALVDSKSDAAAAGRVTDSTYIQHVSARTKLGLARTDRFGCVPVCVSVCVCCPPTDGGASLAVSTASAVPTTSVEITESSPRGTAVPKSSPAQLQFSAVSSSSVIESQQDVKSNGSGSGSGGASGLSPVPSVPSVPSATIRAAPAVASSSANEDDTQIVDEYTDVVKSGYYVSDGCAADGHSHAKSRAGPAPGQPSKCAAKVNSSNDFADSLKV